MYKMDVIDYLCIGISVIGVILVAILAPKILLLTIGVIAIVQFVFKKVFNFDYFKYVEKKSNDRRKRRNCGGFPFWD